MRIVFISQYFFPEQFSNNSIAREMAHRGHEVHAFPCVPNYPIGRFFEGFSNTKRREEIWNEVRISRVFTIPRGQNPAMLLLNYLTYPIATAWSMFRKLRHRADVSFVSMPSPLFQAFAGIVLRWRTGTPCVYWVQDIWPESATYTLGLRNRLIVGVLNRICGWLYRQADVVLIQSAAFRGMIERFGVASDRIRVFPNTAPESYRALDVNQAEEYAHLIPSCGFRLMFAGNIGESQDFDTLIAAAAILHDYADLHWIIVGSGRDEQRVRGIIAERGLDERFHFIGRHPEESMPKIFAHADAMIVSLKDIPIFDLTVPYKMQCYMACGKPIIASLNGEGARILNDSQAGIAVPAGRPNALADAIIEMMKAGPLGRSIYSKRSLEYFEENYCAKKIYTDLENALYAASLQDL